MNDRIHTRTRPRRDEGSMAWVVVLSLVLVSVGAAIVGTSMTAHLRYRAELETTLIAQRVEDAKAAALAALADEPTVPVGVNQATTDCVSVQKRSLCTKFWANPVPLDATTKTRYDVVLNTWHDKDLTRTPPEKGVRASLLPAQAITYQDRPGVTPVVRDGWVEYPTTPLALFDNALHSFTASTLEGPQFEVLAYNHVTKNTGTSTSTVSSDGIVSYGRDTMVDRTLLWGGASGAGDLVERCTGEACEESPTEVVKDTHAKPTAQSEDWIVDPTRCGPGDPTGDWIASQNGGMLPPVSLCVPGDLIIDTPTVRSSADVEVYVHGNVIIRSHLGEASALWKDPSRIRLYVAGDRFVVSNTDQVNIAALVYAPFATCGNEPTGHLVAYFGSLVCDTISIRGPWTHQWDEAGTMTLTDPVPGARKVWTIGPERKINPGEYTDPVEWSGTGCSVPPMMDALGAWTLNEESSTTEYTAADTSAMGRDGTWMTQYRAPGLCKNAAMMSAGGSVAIPMIEPAPQFTILYWAQGAVGTVWEGAGYTVEHTADRHVKVSYGNREYKFPFTVQNAHSWHRYAIVVSPGTAQLWIDGVERVSVPTTVTATSSGAGVIGEGTQGAVDEVAIYARALSAAEIEDDWDTWKSDVTFTETVVGTKFDAPRIDVMTVDVGNQWFVEFTMNLSGGTVPGKLDDPKLWYGTARWYIEARWVGASTHTQVIAEGDVEQYPATFAVDAVPVEPHGVYRYRACLTYNGDFRCSDYTEDYTLAFPPAAP